MNPPGNIPPELVGNSAYVDIRELNKGGMGVVYLAKNRLMNRLEVLKVVSAAFVNDPVLRKRFLREIQAAGQLLHQNIVVAYSAQEVGRSIMMAMEYVPGENLWDLVTRSGALSVRRASTFGYQIASGLQHAFERGLVHRDIKPSNVICTTQNKKTFVKIVDFGLAKLSRENLTDGNLTATGASLGTPLFMAPEQARDAAAADIRADIYSLGATLYFLLAARPPITGKNYNDILIRLITEEPDTPLRKLRSDVTPELAAVVERMLKKDPRARFQTPAEAAQALVPFLKQKSSLDPAKRPGYPQAAGGVPITRNIIVLDDDEDVPDSANVLPPVVTPVARKIAVPVARPSRAAQETPPFNETDPRPVARPRRPVATPARPQKARKQFSLARVLLLLLICAALGTAGYVSLEYIQAKKPAATPPKPSSAPVVIPPGEEAKPDDVPSPSKSPEPDFGVPPVTSPAPPVTPFEPVKPVPEPEAKPIEPPKKSPPLVRPNRARMPVEVRHTPAACFLAVTVDAARLKANLTALGVPVETGIANVRENKQIDLEQFSRGTMVIHPGTREGKQVLPIFFATTVPGSPPVDLQKVVFGNVEATNAILAGKDGLKGKGEFVNKEMMFATAFDDRNVAFGPESAMTMAIEDAAQGGELAAELGKVDRNQDVVIVLAMKPLLTALEEVYGGVDNGIPPAAEQFWTAAKGLDTAHVAINLSDATFLRGTFRAKDADAAGKIRDALQNGMALLSLALPEVKKQLDAQLPPEARSLLTVLEAIAKNSKYDVTGSTTVWTVARPADFANPPASPFLPPPAFPK
ncbi:serine/threonine protein kinase [Limnoglobus roseus]|uniref:Serine/threonine protein kinase n=1 Tax=Limnoglobus roseus TaxID=2598579 RepID=A0A5C1A9Y3_9BACT|nr:serine/threonine-protein kinase [Limnoglobus roseus]QEL13934.1 serine/threonine protein kinase [Limnoglobus roseus]